MTTISPYGYGGLGTQRAVETYKTLKGDFADLQTELSTGKAASTYGGLGKGAVTSLDVRQRLATLSGYTANIADAQTRVSVLNTGIETLNSLATSVRSAAQATTPTDPTPGANTQIVAQGALEQAIDVLNTDVSGRYLFSGLASDTAPVASAGLILDGDATHAGLKTLVSERQQADGGYENGSELRGRLTLATDTTNGTVTLAEEAAGLPFGLKLASSSSSAGQISVATAAGAPVTTTITVGSQPPAGSTVTLGFTLPDGSGESVTLTAKESVPGSGSADGSFQIGSTPGDTAQNIAYALKAQVTALATTKLPSASAVKAATDFFASPGTAVPRVVPPAPPAAADLTRATTTTAGTADDTVSWYLGEAGTLPARDTAAVRIDDSESVGIGARANEAAFQTTLANVAVLAASSFPASDATSAARYTALSQRVATNLGFPDGAQQSIADVAADIGNASAQMSSTKSRLSATSNQLGDVLDGVENANTNDVAAKLLSTQTRLQASYQTTATISKLSLVNYL